MFDRNKILVVMEYKGLTKYALSKLSGISQTTLGDVLGGKKVSPKVATLERIAEALEVPVASFFNDSDVKAEDKISEYTDENKMFFSKFEKLNPAAKKQLLKIIETFEDETQD